MHTTVSDLNKHVISEMVSVAKDFGTNSLRFQYLSETPPAAVSSTMFNGTCIGSERFIPNDVSFLLKKEGIKVFRDQINKITETKSTDELKISSKYLSNLSDKRIISGCFPVKQCTIVKRRILVNPWGEVFPCAHLNYIFGSLKNNSLEEILTSETYTSLVQFLENNLFPVCNHCCNYPHNLTQLQLFKLGSGLKN
jgi:radical SAM protein with 4Fe4S-binding SPASM domain